MLFGNLHPRKKPPLCPSPTSCLKRTSLFHIDHSSPFSSTVCGRWSSLRASVVKCHALSLSSVKQIKGGICLYCASKSPAPLTADTSHVDAEEDVYTEAPAALFPQGRRYANQTNRLWFPSLQTNNHSLLVKLSAFRPDFCSRGWKRSKTPWAFRCFRDKKNSGSSFLLFSILFWNIP